MNAFVAVDRFVKAGILCHVKCRCVGSPTTEELQHVHLCCFGTIVAIAAAVRTIALRIMVRGLQIWGCHLSS